jgi:hypothetical protein
LILGAGSVLVGVMFLLAGRSGGPARTRQGSPTTLQPPSPQPATPEPAGPLTALEPPLREAIEATLAAYGRALETADAAALAAARPDLTAATRDERLEPFRGALNAAIDLRVLDVRVSGDVAVAEVLARDVIVGGRLPARPPANETLRFERRAEGWRLGAAP